MTSLLNKQILDQWVEKDLITENNVEQALTLIKEDNDQCPWYIHVLSSFGAWVSAWMFFFVVALLGILDEDFFMIIGGLLLLATLFISYKNKDISTFFTQLLLVISLTGHILFSIGVIEIYRSEALVAILLIPISIIFIFFFKQSLHKFLSFHIIVFSIIFLSYDLHVLSIVAPIIIAMLSIGTLFLWLNESYFLVKSNYKVYVVLKYACVTALIITTSYFSFKHEMFFYDSWEIPYLTDVAIAISLFMTMIYLITHIIKRLKIGLIKPITISVITIISLLSILFYHTPAIMVSFLVLTLGIERGNKILIPLGVIALISTLIHYYYNLDLSLLHKSLLLMASGSVILVTGIFANHYSKKIGAKNA
ncbi:MAG: DUF4401 domain-containing protein [Thiotrichaceae bacterium]|nr:DUF4401 domain-containing protein [Thiotrichaceae bacterium]